MNGDLGSLIGQLLQGIGTVGKALTSLIQYAFSLVGLEVPDYAVSLGTIIFLILLLYKFGNVISKIVLFALIFLLMSSAAGLIAPLFS